MNPIHQTSEKRMKKTIEEKGYYSSAAPVICGIMGAVSILIEIVLIVRSSASGLVFLFGLACILISIVTRRHVGKLMIVFKITDDFVEWTRSNKRTEKIKLSRIDKVEVEIGGDYEGIRFLLHNGMNINYKNAFLSHESLERLAEAFRTFKGITVITK